jgi:hypothetical protein
MRAQPRPRPAPRPAPRPKPRPPWLAKQTPNAEKRRRATIVDTSPVFDFARQQVRHIHQSCALRA